MEYSIVTVNVDIFIVINIDKYINFVKLGGFNMKVNIASGRINGLNNEKFYSEGCCSYQWAIYFTETSTIRFLNLSHIVLGKDEKEAEKLLEQYKKNFEDAGIREKSEIAVLYGENKSVFAIGRLRKDIWIDVDDNFSVKTFSKLNVCITSLQIDL